MGSSRETLKRFLSSKEPSIPLSSHLANTPLTTQHDHVSRPTFPSVPTRSSSSSSAVSSNYCPSDVSSDKTSDSIETSASSVSSTPHDYGYDLPCEFIMMGCEVTFHATQFEFWHSHTLSHFHNRPPPSKSICIFCDQVTFESRGDPQDTWRKRMIHIDQHYQGQQPNVRARPDFFLLDHLRNTELITADDYADANQYTERPDCPGLVPDDFKPPETIAKEKRNERTVYDLEKENREMRRRNKKRRAKEARN